MGDTITQTSVNWDEEEDLESNVILGEDISKLLKDLDPYMVHGPEEVSPYMLK